MEKKLNECDKERKIQREELWKYLDELNVAISRLKQTQLDKYTILTCEEIINRKIKKIKKL